jgi:hypothetical protein
MYILFSVAFTSSPPSHHGSVFGSYRICGLVLYDRFFLSLALGFYWLEEFANCTPTASEK